MEKQDPIRNLVKEKRPTLSASSVTTYTSILRNLFKKVFPDQEMDVSKFRENTEEILKFLENIPSSKRKTILSALVVVTDDKAYRDLMLDDVRNYNQEVDMQTKTETQRENWVSGGDIQTIYDALKQDADILFRKKNLTPSDLQQIQNYVIMSLLGGFFVPPRRAKDFTEFKIKNVDRAKDNFVDKNKMIFNVYKTAKTYGQQSLDVPKPLKAILAKWIKVNPTDYLLFDSNMNKLTSVKLNQRLNKIFDNKRVGINGLRHTFLTEKYAKTSEENKKLSKDMEAMGSSVQMSDNYIKLH